MLGGGGGLGGEGQQVSLARASRAELNLRHVKRCIRHCIRSTKGRLFGEMAGIDIKKGTPFDQNVQGIMYRGYGEMAGLGDPFDQNVLDANIVEADVNGP